MFYVTWLLVKHFHNCTTLKSSTKILFQASSLVNDDVLKVTSLYNTVSHCIFISWLLQNILNIFLHYNNKAMLEPRVESTSSSFTWLMWNRNTWPHFNNTLIQCLQREIKFISWFTFFTGTVHVPAKKAIRIKIFVCFSCGRRRRRTTGGWCRRWAGCGGSCRTPSIRWRESREKWVC